MGLEKRSASAPVVSGPSRRRSSIARRTGFASAFHTGVMTRILVFTLFGVAFNIVFGAGGMPTNARDDQERRNVAQGVGASFLLEQVTKLLEPPKPHQPLAG